MSADTMRRAMAGTFWYVSSQGMNEMLALIDLLSRDGATQPLTQFLAQHRISAAGFTVPSGAAGSVAVIPIRGMISSRPNIFSYYFGGTSAQGVSDQLRQALADPAVSAIILDIDSPGGAVQGIDEVASEIYAARKTKPVTAVANGLCASAAYYLASQASEVLAAPSSLVGSIGVYLLHEDDSQMLANAGVKITPIAFGENKVETAEFAPLGDDAKEHLQSIVDANGDAFEKAVARGRGVKQEDVHRKFGQGRVFDAKRAVRLGMADRIGTMDDALAKHGAMRSASRGRVVAMVAAAAGDTKSVDGKECPKTAFAYRPDDNKENWKLPVESPDGDAEWEKTHIRNAISRWSSTDMPDAEERDKARSRIRAAARKHDIEISDGSLAESAPVVEGSDLERRFSAMRHELEIAAL